MNKSVEFNTFGIAFAPQYNMRTVLVSLFCFLIGGPVAAQDGLLTAANPFSKGARTIGLNAEPDPEPEKERPDWKERISFGGAASVNFGTITFILLNPQVIYKLNRTTWLSAGPYYSYFSQRIGGSRFSSSIYGATGFARKYIREDLFLQAEYNQLYLPLSGGGRVARGYGMAGGGYQPHPNFSLTVLYIFTQDPSGYLPFGGSPWVIRGGINF